MGAAAARFPAKSAERAVVGGDFTVVLADSGADNRESQAGTTGFAVAGFIRAVERTEDMFAIFGLTPGRHHPPQC